MDLDAVASNCSTGVVCRRSRYVPARLCLQAPMFMHNMDNVQHNMGNGQQRSTKHLTGQNMGNGRQRCYAETWGTVNNSNAHCKHDCVYV